MELSSEEEAYVTFMQWFQTTHPGLYIVFWKAILQPAPGEALTFDSSAVAPGSHTLLISIIQEYYTTGKSTRH